MSPAGSLPLSPSAQGALRPQILATRTAPQVLANGPLLGRVLAAARTPAAARDGLRRPLAITGPLTEPCSLSGSVSITFDDRDNNAVPSVGDVMTLAFANCRESPTEQFDGSAVVVYTQISQVPVPTIGARLTMTQLSAADSQHSVRLNGTVLMDFRQPSAGAEITRFTAEGNLSAAVTTHVFADTVTMRDGFWFESVYDPTAGPPAGSVVRGRTTSTMQGEVESTAASGVLNVVASASAPIVDYDADPNPRSGVMRVTSRKGTLLLTAVSPQQVRIDLDADDNAIFESSETVSWDWLL